MISRKEFLRAGAAGALLGPAALARPAAAAARPPRLSPLDLAFRTVAQYRPFEIVARGFEALTDDYRGRPVPARVRAKASPAAPYAAVQAAVASFGSGTLYAGLLTTGADRVVATFTASSVTIEAVSGGQARQLAQAAVALGDHPTVAFVLNEDNVIALADTGAGFVPLLRAGVAPLDLRDPAVLRRYAYGFGARGGAVALGRVSAGYWGKAGVRDPHVVTWADGTPFIENGKAYLTLTNAGLGFFQFAHWGVYTLDLHPPYALRQIGKIFWERDGHVVGDHAGHIVYDDAIRAFRVLVSNWGTFSGSGVLINHAVVRGDVLRGVTVVRNPSVLPLPTGVSRWDPHAVRIRDRWYVAFVESPSQNPFTFHPALARGPRGGRFGDFTLVGRDAARTMTEGMVVQKIGGRWYVLCSSSRDEGPPDGGHYLVYDLAMRFRGFLNAPYPTNIPHPMVFPVPGARSRSTHWRMVTFDGTQYHEEVLGYGTHGDFSVMQAQTTRGYEFAPRALP